MSDESTRSGGVYVRTKAGRVHLGAIVNDDLKVSEACNLDDARGELEVLGSDPPTDVDLDLLCARCFSTSDDSTSTSEAHEPGGEA